MRRMDVTTRDRDKAREIARRFQTAARSQTMSGYVAAMDEAERYAAEALAYWREHAVLQARLDHREGAD